MVKRRLLTAQTPLIFMCVGCCPVPSSPCVRAVATAALSHRERFYESCDLDGCWLMNNPVIWYGYLVLYDLYLTNYYILIHILATILFLPLLLPLFLSYPAYVLVPYKLSTLNIHHIPYGHRHHNIESSSHLKQSSQKIGSFENSSLYTTAPRGLMSERRTDC